MFYIKDMAAAEVLVRGCCSTLNTTKHHLVSSWPPSLATFDDFKADFLSPVQKKAKSLPGYVFATQKAVTKGAFHGQVSRPTQKKVKTIKDSSQIYTQTRKRNRYKVV